MSNDVRIPGVVVVTSANIYPTYNTSPTANYSGPYGTYYGTYYPTGYTTGNPNYLPTIEGLEIALTAVFLVLTLCTIVGNSMALSVFYRITVRKNVSVAFFMSMAIADLANGLIVMPLSLYAICNNRLQSDNADIPGFDNFCSFTGVTNNLTNKAALFILVLIGMDRFLSVYVALRKAMILTLKKSFILIAVCWLCAMLLALIPFYFSGERAYYYYNPELQCNWNPYDLFNTTETEQYIEVHDQHFPPKIVLMFFFTVMLPIICSTLLVVFFCISVALGLRKHMKRSRLLRATQQATVCSSDTRRLRNSLRNSTVMRSFKRKASEKPVTIQMDKVEAGYTEIDVGTGIASDGMEGHVVLRRKSRQVQNRMASPRTARDRWSQMSIRSNIGKKTKVDQQKKAISTVIIMLLFCILCHGMSWVHVIDQFLVANALIRSSLIAKIPWPQAQYYMLTVNVLLRYINSAGNPFLYYFRMVQFKKEVSDIMASLNGTTNRIYTSIRSGQPNYSRSVRYF